MNAWLFQFLTRFPKVLSGFEFLSQVNTRKLYFLLRFFCRLTGKRIINFLRVEYNYRRRNPQTSGYPYTLVIDPTNRCNLRCPLCPTGLGKQGRKPGMMRLEDFKRAIDVLAEYAFAVVLYNWGEPLLNKQVYDMIKYASQHRLMTFLSTNLNFLNQESAKRIIESELDHLRVSIDGATPETYQWYRRGGDFYTVLRNVEFLLETRQKLQAKHPLVDWYFIVMRHNEHEMWNAWQTARRLGFDHIYFTWVLPMQTFKSMELPFLASSSRLSPDVKPEGISLGNLAEEWFPTNKAFRPAQNPEAFRHGACPWLWKNIVINYDGTVAPCCYIDDSSADLGSILDEPFEKVWNNEQYYSSRQAFRTGAVFTVMQKTACWTCNFY